MPPFSKFAKGKTYRWILEALQGGKMFIVYFAKRRMHVVDKLHNFGTLHAYWYRAWNFLYIHVQYS